MSSLSSLSFSKIASNDAVIISDIDAPIPEGLPAPETWRLLMMPVRAQSRTKGGIILTEDTIDAQFWNHQLFKVAAVGPNVYSGPAYAKLGLTPEQMPKVGDLYLINPRNPDRFMYQGVNFLIVSDEQLRCKVDPRFVSGFKFFGFET
jgi:co-chaperonin GroES (HSP10)